MPTNTNPSDKAPDVLRELRQMMPLRKLTYGQHLQLAERQATRLHQLLDQRSPAVDLTWLTELPGVTIVPTPRYKMNGISGLASWSGNGWAIGINKNEPHVRRRFTLVHEFKHVLDAARDRITYSGLKPDRKDAQREQIADYFAACYLMPKMWLRRAWTNGIQDPEALAGLFKVSQQAMEIRLRYLGYTEDEPDRDVASYFRLSGDSEFEIDIANPAFTGLAV